MGKYTPGPWRRGAVTRTITAKAGKQLVADCRGGGSVHPAVEDECEANARLIAAAPELLKSSLIALNVMLDYWPDDMDSETSSPRNPGVVRATKLLLRAAIAKAEGG